MATPETPAVHPRAGTGTGRDDPTVDDADRGRPRRRVLRAGAGAATAVWLASCGRSSPAPPGLPRPTASGPAGPARPGSSAPGRPTAASSPRPADWAALARDLDGMLVRPGDRRYGAARRLFQPQFDGVRPAGVAYVSGPRDAAACLAFARRHGVPVRVRGGGHSYAGWSTTGGGLVIDVGRLDDVSVSGGTAAVGAGARLVDVYARLAGRGVTVPAGSCPTVGIAGLALGGGVGVTARAHGLTSDNVTAVEIVTADGRIRTADAGRDADLFWALRGGGGGNFGVVTGFTVRTRPAPDCAYGYLSWPWSRAAAVVTGWQRWAPYAPDDTWSALHLSAYPGSRPRVTATVVHLGGVPELERRIARLAAQVRAEPSSSSVHGRPYLEAMLALGGCAGWRPAQCHLPGTLPGQDPAGRTTRESYQARSDFYTRPLPGAGVGVLLAAVERYARTVPGGSGWVALDALGGAVNRVGPGDTAFVHRDGLFLAQYIANRPDGSAAGRYQAWLDGLWRAMRPYASGQAYQNYADPRLTDWQRAYYGANLTRLRRVKAAYDPDTVFSFPQALPG